MKNFSYLYIVIIILSGGLLLFSGCKKDTVMPSVSTTPVVSVTFSEATTGGNVTSDGGAPIMVRGVVYGVAQNPTTADSITSNGTGMGVFTSKLTGLTASTLYYVRAYATNSVGTAYGNQLSFTTSAPPAGLASITTTVATAIASTVATTGGNVTSDGGAAVTARGVAYGTSQNPTTANNTTSDGIGTGAFTSALTGLTSSTLYYVRAYAMNAAGTAYGNEESFTTSFSCGTSMVSDIDNNTYNTVQIGSQCWMQSNLKVIKYRNGDNIPTGLSDAQWSSTTSGATVVYNSNAANDALYGKLYNWFAVNDLRGLCPTGWHVPSDSEWATIILFSGGMFVAGGAMKSTNTQPTPGGWFSPNTGATNSSRFTGLPGGGRVPGGVFDLLNSIGSWWSSSDAGPGLARHLLLESGNANSYRLSVDQRNGFSVRCIRD